MSCVRETHIEIIGTEYSYSGSIGWFIDQLIDKHRTEVIDIGGDAKGAAKADSVVLDLKDTYKIVGVSNDEKTSWMRISQVSRHPANGGLVKITTMSGKTTTATLSHSFLKRTENGIEPIRGSDLVIGMKVPIAQGLPAPTRSGTITWEEIIEIEYLDDPRDYVYDFTVPGNDSFMVDEGILVHNTLNT